MPTIRRYKVANGEEHNGVELKGAEKAWVLKEDSQGKPARRAKMEVHLAHPHNILKKPLGPGIAKPTKLGKKSLELFNDGTTRGANKRT
jgi:hypothetical protein